MADKPSFFITTPIYYVNAAPHLGTAYCTMLCDVQARYRRAVGYDVKFLTGMDEHGEKVAEAAHQHGFATPQEWCDSQAPLFKDLWQKLEISNDDFIRTTEPRQNHAVQHLWERMRESGYLYKGSYDGWYCVPEETYFTENQVKKSDEERGTKGEHLCPDCGRPLERVQEESYFFKLSAFQDKLLALYDERPDFVQPAFRMNEVRSFVEGGLTDLSVSRTSFDWGIKVPFDEKHVTYVWFDALLNYMTSVGYGVDSDEARAELAYRWPAQYHVVGKDIIVNLLESIRICAHLFAPFMPETSAEVLRRMSLADEADTDDLAAACEWGGLAGGVEVTKGDALFPRLASEKK